tara:strand:- start:174 stop:398 length:225 start_codon:yes stop_codon:yes gene_type:complete
MTVTILEALASQYIADLKKLAVNIENYTSNSVGVAEHPDIVTEVDKLIEQVASAEEKLKIVQEMLQVELERSDG